jgi:multiple sugar transport system substrate-binding protein
MSTILVVATACGSGDGGSDAGAAAGDAGTRSTAEGGGLSGEVRVWTFLDPENDDQGRAAALKMMMDDFEAAHPGVDIVVEPQNYAELESLFLSNSALGTEPDIIMAQSSSIPAMNEAGALADLNQTLSQGFVNDALPNLMAEGFARSLNSDGAQVALPIWPNAGYVIAYRGDLLTSAGYDSLPTDWDEFTQMASELSNGDVFGFGVKTVSTAGSQYFSLVAASGPEAWDEAFDDATGQFDFLGPASIRAAEQIRALRDAGAIPEDVINSADDDVQEQFAAGRFATGSAFSPDITLWREIAAEYDPATLRFGPYPSFDSNPAPTVIDGWTWGMSATPDNADAAAAFIESMYTVEASVTWASVGGQLPDRIEAFEDPYFDSDDGQTQVDLYDITQSPGAVSFPSNLDTADGEFFAVTNEAFQQLIATDRPIEEILDEAATNAYG